MNTSVVMAGAEIRLVSQNIGMDQNNDQGPEEKLSTMDKLTRLIDFSINYLRKCRFILALEHYEEGSNLTDSELSGFDSAIDKLRKDRFIRTLKKFGYS